MMRWSLFHRREVAPGLQADEARHSVDAAPVGAGLAEGDIAAEFSAIEALLAADPARAHERAENLLRHQPDSPHALRLAATAAQAAGDVEAALDCYTLLLHLHPDDWPATFGMANLLRRQGELQRARRILELYLERFPAHADARLELALALHAGARFADAVDQLRQLLSRDPDNAAALNMLGLVLAREMGDLEEGERLIARALDSSPGWMPALSNLAWVLAEQGRIDEARPVFDAVLAQFPEDHETRYMRALACLKHGEFKEGWADYHARHKGDAPAGDSAVPWLTAGENAAGKRILVRAEQGLGDQILFASCLLDLVGLGARCTVECDPRLKPLLERSFRGVDCIDAPTTNTGRYPAIMAGEEQRHLQVMMGDLPRLFRGDWQDFPNRAGYLLADPQAVARWRERLQQLGPGLKIGISWRGGTATTRQQLRSMPPEVIASALSGPANAAAVHLVSLQYGDCEEELAQYTALGLPRIHHWAAELQDYDSTAALVMALDCVVSICTSVVDLAGALGKSTWVLTPAIAEWRYMAVGERLPWYPSLRLVRQLPGEPWSKTAGRLQSELVAGRLAT